MATEWLTAGEARARLSVQAQTLYAYVSRGLIRSERVPGTRSSRYARGDVERLPLHDLGVRVGAVVFDSFETLAQENGPVRCAPQCALIRPLRPAAAREQVHQGDEKIVQPADQNPGRHGNQTGDDPVV